MNITKMWIFETFNDQKKTVDGCNQQQSNHQSQTSKKIEQRDASHSVCGHSVKHYSIALHSSPCYPRPMIPIISIRTTFYGIFFAFHLFEVNFCFFFRVRFVVIRSRRGQKMCLEQLKLPTSEATYGSKRKQKH